MKGSVAHRAHYCRKALDDFVSETNPVRVVDVFVDELDLRTLGFAGVDPADTGRPAYHPAGVAQALHLRLPESDPVEPTPGARGTGIVGYNAQTAVEAKNHLIVAHEVTNDGLDRDQLSRMGKQARKAMRVEYLTAIADRGYYECEEILACHKAGIIPLVPKTATSGAKFEGRFDKADFVYNKNHDEYICPAGERLIWRYTSIQAGLKMRRYWSSHCPRCPIKAKCTPGENRRVSRWVHEEEFELMQTRLDHASDSMRIRRQTVEHPLGTPKAWMGATHFLTKGLERVRTEMSLHMLAYNLQRVMNLLGNEAQMAAMKA